MLRHLTAKIAGTATSPSDNKSKFKTPEQPKRTVRMWACDVCKKPFPDFDEACRHEQDCRRRNQKKNEQPVHSFFQAQGKTEGASATSSNDSSVMIHDSSPSASKTIQVWSCDVCQKRSKDYDEACIHEAECRAEKLKVAAAAAKSSKPVHPFFTEAKQEVKQPTKTSVAKLPSSVPQEQIILLDDTPVKKRKTLKQKDEIPTKKPRTQTPATTNVDKSKRATKSRTTSKPPLASIFSSDTSSQQQQFLAEHRAAEFVAKRRAEADRERERQKRRREHAELHKKATPALQPKRMSKHPPAVRFPNPSHVMPFLEPPSIVVATESRLSVWGIHEDMLSRAQERLVKTPKYPGSERPLLEEISDCPTLLSAETLVAPTDPLQKALSDLLFPSDKPTNDGMLWCDKYSIQSVPQDVCGEGNRETAQELVAFVEDWKVERHRAHGRRAEKQQALLKKRKARKYKDDDELWEDSDNEESGLCSVCLLTGPTGSGKTSLVHAVARQSECVVLEINTSEKRGGQALKNAIEEATQSDSSLDMLKKSKISSNVDPFQDSDDESEANEKGSSVNVVLIDEVDLMYEDEGDSGFWAALNSLRKKAKCPIVLTANAVPDSLLSSSMRYLHLEMSLPTPKECASKMRRIIKSEGLRRYETPLNGSDPNEQLSLIAELCRCDLRRICNELQLFSSGPVRIEDQDCIEKHVKTTSPETTATSRSDDASPTITDISPKQVSPHDPTLLTITGKNFNSFSTTSGSETTCQVTIGSQLCRAARIMDDSTILAVCPPCLLPSGVDDCGAFEGSALECRTCRFAPVSLRGHAPTGAIVTTDAAFSTTQLCDGTPATFLGPKWNVEYGFPPPRRAMLEYVSNRETEDDESVEEEFEVETTTTAAALPHSTVAKTSPQCADSAEEAAAILEKGVREWNVAHSKSPIEEGDKSRPAAVSDSVSARNVEIWASQAELASDVALLEDGFEYGGVPFLAGVVPGFGTGLVNDIAANNVRHTSEGDKKLLRNVNARPPSFERLHSLGWNEEGCFFGNSNSYMRYPTDSRERRLLARSESHERGLSRPLSKGLAAADAQQDEDHQTLDSDPSLSDTLTLSDAACRVSDEDLFIRPSYASSIVTLPEYLGRHLNDSDSVYHPLGKSELARLPMVAQDNAFRRAGLLSDLMQNEPDVSKHHFVRSIFRLTEISTAPLHDRMDESTFLEYLPMLCQMSMYERAAEHAFQQVCASDPEAAAAMSGRRRTTRRSGNTPSRTHYFVTTGWCKENSAAIDTGAELAAHVLSYTAATDS